MFAAAKTPPHFVTLVLLTALSTLTLNLFLPSLSAMAVEFGVDYSLMNLAIAGYLGVTAILQLVIGPLSDRYGRRPVMLCALAIFTLASLGCALAQDAWVFLGFRVLQGIVISGWAISQASIRDVHPPREAASLMGYVVMAMAVAPMLGPILGGFLDQYLGWRSSFYFLASGGALMFTLAWLDLGETNTQRAETLAAQLRAYPELFRSRRFWGYALCMAFSVGAFYAFLSGVPLVARTILEMPPAELGIYMGSISAGFFFGGFLSGRYAKRLSLTTMMIAGRLAACFGLLAGMALFAMGIVTPASLFGATLFVGFGNGLTMPSSNAGALSVRPNLAGSASGLAGALVVGIGALLTSLTGAIVSAEDGHYELLTMMLASSAIGMLAALYVLRIDRREGAVREHL